MLTSTKLARGKTPAYDKLKDFIVRWLAARAFLREIVSWYFEKLVGNKLFQLENLPTVDI